MDRLFDGAIRSFQPGAGAFARQRLYLRLLPAAAESVSRSEPERQSSDFPRAVCAGQIDAEVLRNRYRAEKLSNRTALYGLLGCPIGHSLGAAIHNAALPVKAGVDAVYVPLLSSDLKDFRSAARPLPLGRVQRHHSSQARDSALGGPDGSDGPGGGCGQHRPSVRRGRWEAINTDVEGIMVPLRKALRLGSNASILPRRFPGPDCRQRRRRPRRPGSPSGKLRCRDIFVTGRKSRQGSCISQKLWAAKPIPMGALRREQFGLLIHATSVGMWPEDGSLPPAAGTGQRKAGVSIWSTILPKPGCLKIARARGCRTIPGLEMFLAQAARQFEYWTGLAGSSSPYANHGPAGAFPAPATRHRRSGFEGMILPGPEKFSDLARQGNLIPVWKSVPADLLTPVSAYLKLTSSRTGARHNKEGRNQKNFSFLFESVEGGETIARYTYLGADPFLIVRFRMPASKAAGRQKAQGGRRFPCRLRARSRSSRRGGRDR